MALCDGAVLDDFGAVLDDASARGAAASLRKRVEAEGLRRVLVATSKAAVVSWLGADFVLCTPTMQLHSRTGKFQRPKVDIQLGKDVAFRQGRGVDGGGVQGEEDVGDSIDADEEAERAGRRREEVELTRHVELRTSVCVDARVEYAANAFEYDFDGESVVRVPEVPDVGPFAVGLLVGPSGSGKSTPRSRLAAQPSSA